MRLRPTAILTAALAFLPYAHGEIRSRPVPGTDARPRPAPAVLAAPVSLPAEFEENRGQSDPAVRFLARPRGYRAYFADGETVFVLPRGNGAVAPLRPGLSPPSAGADVVRLRFEGARPAAPAAGAALPGRSSYFIGDDPDRWVRDVPHFADLLARNLYDGIDLRWRGIPGGGLEYDLLLAPGADPAAIDLRFEGARSVATDAGGRLLVSTEGGILRHARPVAFQESGGRRLPVEARFVVEAGPRVRFAVGRFDPSLPLVIDPQIDYSTFLGGTYAEQVNAVGADGAGSFYAAGTTGSLDFPTMGAPPGAKGSNNDAFVTKFNAAGSALAWSTYLGGFDNDTAFGIAVAANGTVVVCGFTSATNFPTVTPLQVGMAGQSDAFITKIAAAGNSLTFSTYLGGTGGDVATGVVFASDGSAVVAGATSSAAFPTTVGSFQKNYAGNQDAFVARLTVAGSALAWCTFVGGSNQDYSYSLGIDSSNRPVIVGSTYSTNFPTSSPAQASNGGLSDAFITKLAADGSALAWSTYFGGSEDEYAFGVALASDDRVWTTGQTYSTNLPTTGAFQQASGTPGDAFVARMSADGSNVQMATYLGGGGEDIGQAIAVDRDGSAFVGGITNSTNFPLQAEIQSVKGGQFDNFLTQFQASSATPPFSTYIGGTAEDRLFGLAIDSNARVAVGGYTNGAANTYPRVNAYDSTLGGTMDGVLTVIKRLPYAPKDLAAALASLTSVELTWTDIASGETGFQVERAADGVNFAILATTAPNVVQYLDAGLDPSTTYTYRLRTVAGAYRSDPCDPAEVATPATPTFPPAAPTNLVATVASPRRVDLAWQDDSDNEDFFVLARAVGPGLYATLATPQLGATSAADLTPLPGRTYSWKLRAVNPVGPSFDSNIETLTMPSTLDASLVKGRILAKEATSRDSVALSGVLEYGPDALSGEFDPQVQAFSVRLGSVGAPALVDIAGGDEGWRLRRGKWTWKSPKGSITKAKVAVIPATGAWTVSLSHLNLAAAPANPVRVTVTAGTDEGHLEGDWTAPTRAGKIQFPVPVPK